MVPSDGKFGVADENGSWSGIIGMLTRRVCHVTVFRFFLVLAKVLKGTSNR